MKRALLRYMLALPVLTLTVGGCKSGSSARGPTFEVFPAARTEVAFKPPLGPSLRERSITERTDVVSATPVKSRVELVTQSSWSEDKGSFVLAQKVTTVRAAQDGKPVEDPLAQLVTRFSTRFAISQDGTFVRFLNPEDVQKAVVEAFPDPRQAAEVLSFFTPEAIEDQARIEWEQEFGGLFGRPIESAQPWYTLDGTAVGEVPVLFMIERTFAGTTQTDFGEAAVFTLRCVQKAEDAKDRSGFEALMTERGSPSLEPSVTCEGRQVIARERFVPIAQELRIRAKPGGAAAGEVELFRTTTTEELK